MLDFGNALLAMQIRKSMIMQEEQGGGGVFLLLNFLLVLYPA